MTVRSTIKSIMKFRGFTYATLAKALGYKTPSSVSERLRHNPTTTVLLRLLDAMNCDLIVKSRLADKREWVVTLEDGEDMAEDVPAAPKKPQSGAPKDTQKDVLKDTLRDLLDELLSERGMDGGAD